MTLIVLLAYIIPVSFVIALLGYLMGERDGHKRQTTLECVDQDPEYVPGQEASTDGSLFLFTRAICNKGLSCPPYVDSKAITCVVCTK